MDGVGVVGGHLQLVTTSNGGLLLSKDGLLLGGQVGEPLRLGRGLLLLRGCGILMHFGAVAVIVVLWKVITIFVSCVTHFESAALEGFHAREASTGTPLVKFLTEAVVLCLYEAAFTGGHGPLTTLGVNEGDGRVDNGDDLYFVSFLFIGNCYAYTPFLLRVHPLPEKGYCHHKISYFRCTLSLIR